MLDPFMFFGVLFFRAGAVLALASDDGGTVLFGGEVSVEVSGRHGVVPKRTGPQTVHFD